MAYGYIAKLNEHVIREHVRFNNRYGIAIAADIYRAKNMDESGKYPTCAVTPQNRVHPMLSPDLRDLF